MSKTRMGDYLDVQRRRVAGYADDEGSAIVDEPELFGWAGTDPDAPTGRLFVHAPLPAERLKAVLRTYWPLNVSLIEVDGARRCAEVLNASRFYRGVAETVTGMLLLDPGDIALPPLPAELTARMVRRLPTDTGDGPALELAAAACLKADPALAESFSPQQFMAHLRRPSNAALLAAQTDEGPVVGTAGTVLVGADATIYLVSTDPAYRGRGLATAMTARAIHEAAARGADVICLDASAAGHSIYRRLGFTPAANLRVWNRLR